MSSIIKVSMFKNINSKYTSGVVNLWDWLLIRNPYTTLVEQIRKENNPIKQKELKTLLPAITVSCICSERKTDKIMDYTNLICIDIDGKDNPSISNMENLKKELSKLPFVMYCGLSTSGKGLFCIIPYSDHTKHREIFTCLERDLRSKSIIIDKSCIDECRLRFYSYDENPYININAEIYKYSESKTYVEINVKKKNKVKPPKKETILIPNIVETFLQPNNLILESGTPLTQKQKVERLLNEIIRNQVDITYYYHDWITIGHIIKALFGKEGKTLFHKVSQFYPNYDYNETEKVYSQLDTNKYHYQTKRIFEIAVEYKLIPQSKINSL